MHRFLIGSVALALMGGHAMAADMPVKALPPAYSWTGLYIGVNGGYEWGQTQTNLFAFNTPGSPAFFGPANIPGVNAAGSNTFNNTGGVAGGQIGYMIQGGPGILGIEAGFDWMR